jgi:hypothetical protein
MEKPTRGAEREAKLEREDYFSDRYFSMRHLCSFAHQLHHIHGMHPKSAMEIGIGNGFVSAFLRRSGLSVLTADINPALEPDICAPLSEVRSKIAAPVDLVICCEVLEHMPLELLDENLDHLRSLGSRLFLTLPNSYRTWGLGGFAFLPKLAPRAVDLVVNFPWRHPIAGGPHFWEVGYNSECSRRALIGKLRTRYNHVRSGRFNLNPYHVWFECQ